jgi:hypothetical protein
MGTHYHLVLSTPDGRVSSALQQLHGWYSRFHNRARKRSAHLFRAHFFARELTSDADLLWACRYLAYNPVEAGLAPDPFAWHWSSAAASAGLCEAHLPLDDAPLKAAFGNSPAWQERYREFIVDGGAHPHRVGNPSSNLRGVHEGARRRQSGQPARLRVTPDGVARRRRH